MSIPLEYERLEIYRKIADGSEPGTRVDFATSFGVYEGKAGELVTLGLSQFDGEHFHIYVRAGLDPEKESRTFLHELAHIKMKHIPRNRPNRWSQILSQVNLKMVEEGKASEELTKRIKEREAWADLFADICLGTLRACKKITW